MTDDRVLDLTGHRSGQPLVVMLPGLGGGVEQWSDVLEELAPYNVYVTCAERIGARGRRRELRRVTPLAASIASQLRKEIDDDVVLVGHSVGSFVALGTARHLDQRVRCIVVVNGGLRTVAEFLAKPVSTFLRRPRTCLQALRLFALVATPLPGVMKGYLSKSVVLVRLLIGSLVSPAALATPERRRRLLENSGHPDVLAALWLNRRHWEEFSATSKEIFQKVVFLAGTRDPVANLTDTEAMKSMIEHAEVVEVEGAGHALPLEAPDVVTTAIIRGLDPRRWKSLDDLPDGRPLRDDV